MKKDSLIVILEKIRSGDMQLRKKFIEENSKFIAKTVSKTLGKSAVPKNSEEFELGLSAFNYSIDDFDLKSGEDFLIYSETNIKKILYDYSIKNIKALKNQSSTYYNNSETVSPYVNVEDFEEIALFKQNLWKFGITLKEVSGHLQLKPQTLKLCISIAREISHSDELFNKLNSSLSIPVENLELESDSYKKIIRKNRAYIIALCLIARSRLEVLKSYINNIEKNWELYNNIGIVLELSNNEAVIFTEKCRFVTIKDLNGLRVGYEITSNELSKSNSLNVFYKYSLYAACLAVLLGIFLSVNYLVHEISTSPETKDTDVVYPGDTGKDLAYTENSPPPLHEGISPPSENSTPTDAAVTENTQTADNTSIFSNIIPTTSNNTYETAIYTPTPEKDIYTPLISAKQTSDQTTPSSGFETHTPEIKPSISVEPSAYKTVKATGAPGRPHISSDSYEVNVGEDYTIAMHMHGGNNGTKWELYENNILAFTIHCEDSTPNDQRRERIITAKKAGTYTYRCVLTNDFGSTDSTSITVTVK